MRKIRKQLMFSKVDTVLNKKKLVLFFHYNNINAGNWQNIKGELALLGDVLAIVVKNRIAEKRVSLLLSPPHLQSSRGRSRSVSPHASTKGWNNPNENSLDSESLVIPCPASHSGNTKTQQEKKEIPGEEGILLEKRKVQISSQEKDSKDSKEDGLIDKRAKRLQPFSRFLISQKNLNSNNSKGDAPQRGEEVSQTLDTDQVSPLVKKRISSHVKEKKGVAALDLLQGPTLLVGCNSLEEYKLVSSILSKSGSFLLVGGIYKKKNINYSQLNRLLFLENSVYTKLIHTFQTQVGFLLSLPRRYDFHFLSWYQRKLLFLLQQRLMERKKPAAGA